MPPLLSHAPFYLLYLMSVVVVDEHALVAAVDGLVFPGGQHEDVVCFEAEVVYAPAALLAPGSFTEGLSERACTCVGELIGRTRLRT